MSEGSVFKGSYLCVGYIFGASSEQQPFLNNLVAYKRFRQTAVYDCCEPVELQLASSQPGFFAYGEEQLMENMARLGQIQKRIKDWERLVVREAPCDGARARGQDLTRRMQIAATRVWEQKTATAADTDEIRDLERQLWALFEEVRLASRASGNACCAKA